MQWFFAAAFLLFATILPGQSRNTQRTILDRLESADYGDRAWGAYRAAEEGRTELVPKIIPLLGLRDPRLQAVAFDALIRLGADMPKLPPIEIVAAQQLDPVVIVLSRHPERHTDFLLRLLDRPLTSVQWEAINSLLCTAPPHGFAARLLREWKIKFVLTVHGKTAYARWPEGSGDGAIVLGPDRGPTFAGFPPIFSYALHRFIESGDNALVKEPVPIYFGRGQTYIPDTSDVDREAAPFDYLRYLAGTAKNDPTVRLPSDPKFEWVDADKYGADAAQLLEGVRKTVRVIVERLMDRGLLTAAEARSGPQIEVTVYDARGTRGARLPMIDWRLRR